MVTPPLPTPALTLDDAIACAATWKSVPGGYCMSKDPRVEPQDSMFYSRDALYEYDKLMLSVMTYLSPGMGECFEGEHLRASRRYWHGDVLYLPQRALARSLTGIYVSHLADIELTSNPKIARLYLHAYTVYNTNDGVEFVREARYGSVEVKASWLDTQFPQWHTQLAIAHSMEMDPLHYMKTLMPMLTQREKAGKRTTPGHIVLDGVTFDA